LPVPPTIVFVKYTPSLDPGLRKIKRGHVEAATAKAARNIRF